MLAFVKQIFCGTTYPIDKVKKTGNFYEREVKILKSVWTCEKELDFGIERVLRLVCICFQFVSLANVIREICGKKGFKYRKLSVDLYVIFNLLYPLFLVYYGLWTNWFLRFFLIYLTTETVIYLLNLVILQPYIPQASSYTRNLLSIFLNFLQVAFAFAVFYLNAGLNVSGLQAIYFSLVTQTTVGYGDILPIGDNLIYLTILQIIISLLFVYLFFASIISNIGNMTFMHNGQDNEKRTQK